MAALPMQRPSLGKRALCCLAVTALAGWFLPRGFIPSTIISEVAPGATFTGATGAEETRALSPITRCATGPNMPYAIEKKQTKGLQRKLMKRMPDTDYDVEEIMRRVVTILIKNIDERWRDGPMKTLQIAKEIGLRGRQIKVFRFVNDALYLLLAEKKVYKYKQNPIRWCIHEDYMARGLPPISMDWRDPWRMKHLIQLEKTEKPKYGPLHGRTLDKDRETWAKYLEEKQKQQALGGA